MNYLAGDTPDHAYQDWKKNWVAPQTTLRIRKPLVLVEFGPKGTSGAIWQPDGAGYNAMVILDSTGELRQGAEVALEGHESDGFMLDGRQVFLVNKSDILMEVLE